MRPIWLMDIDGVLNAKRPGWSAAPRTTWITGDKVRWAPALIDRIRAIHRDGLAEIRWSTTWNENQFELDILTRALRMPDLERAFADRPMSKTWAELKAEAAVEVVKAGRRLIWTDDTEADIAPQYYVHLADAEQAGQALLIAPRTRRGLQPEHLDRIEAFLKEN